MIAEVNKIILNTLISQGGILLPEVGTLYVKRTPANIISRNSVATPRLNILFATHLQAYSLVDVIASMANIGTAQAKDIYERWLDKVRSGNRLTIEGVGTLNDKSFIVDEQLLRRLNPQSAKDVTITRSHSRGRVLVAAVVAVLLLCVAGAGYYLYDRGVISGVVASADENTELPNIPPRVMTTPAYNITAECDECVDKEETLPDTTIIAEQVTIEESEAEAEAEIAIAIEADEVSSDWRENDNTRHYVVVGSYSTEENAERAIASLEKRFTEQKFSFFKLGTMYAVAAYGSAERDDCEAFKRENKDNFKQSWIYTPRKYRE